MVIAISDGNLLFPAPATLMQEGDRPHHGTPFKNDA